MIGKRTKDCNFLHRVASSSAFWKVGGGGFGALLDQHLMSVAVAVREREGRRKSMESRVGSRRVGMNR